jgi:para-nitrobenzyl esterase
MSSYWANFVKTGDPNEKGLAEWPVYSQGDKFQVMHLSGKNVRAAPEENRARYEFLDAHAPKSNLPVR